MGEKLRRQMPQTFWHIVEVGDANREDHGASLKSFTILKAQLKSVLQAFHTRYEFVFKLGYHAIFEGKPIRGESVKTHRHTGIGILDAPLRTKLFQSKRTFRVVNVRS